MTASPQVKSALRVLEIFELLRNGGGAFTQTRISRELKIPMSSLHAILRTLTTRQYLQEDRESRTYRLGPALLSLAFHTREAADLVETANGVMDELCNSTGESVSLGTLEGSVVVFVHKKVSSQIVQVVNPVGTRLSAHTTALGKCMLASLNDSELLVLYPSRELPAATSHSIAKRLELLATLKRVRAMHFATDREESSTGVYAVGSPIYDETGKAIAAVSVAAPVARATAESARRWRGLVIAAARQISARMGFPKT